MLMQAQELNTRINDDSIIIFDCRFALPGSDFDPDAGRRLYQQGHIPGAIYADLERDLSAAISPTSGRYPIPARPAWAPSTGLAVSAHASQLNTSQCPMLGAIEILTFPFIWIWQKF